MALLEEMVKHEKISYLSLDLIDDPDVPMRTYADEEGIHALADSIRDVGLLNPLIVRPCNKRYKVIAGHRRLLASRMVGLATVPCVLRDVDNYQADSIMLHENLGHEQVGIVDQARFIKRILDENDLTIPELCRKIVRSESFVRDRLMLLSWPEEVIEAIDTQKISFSAARHLAAIEDESARRHYLSAAIRSGISARVAYDWLMAWRKSSLPTPPKIEKKEEKDGEERIEYYTSKCRICGQPIAIGEEEVIYTHQKCMDEIEKLSKPSP